MKDMLNDNINSIYAMIDSLSEEETNTLSLDGYHMVKNRHIFKDLTNPHCHNLQNTVKY